jgi:hypothetical protein
MVLISKQKLGCPTVLKTLVIDESLDTQFKATVKAVNSLKEGDQENLIIVADKDGELTVMHLTESSREKDVTLQSTSKNGGWKIA